MSEIEDLTSALSGLTTGNGPLNLNNGAGQQTNATISGGTHNKQYVAHTQNFLAPSADTSRDLLDIIFITDPSIDRVKLERLKGTINEAGDPQRDNAATMLRAMLWQLVSCVAKPDLLTALNASMVSAARSKQIICEPESMWAIFVKLLRTLPQDREVYCVVDGLDECVAGDQAWVAEKLISSSTDSTSAPLRAVVLSRPVIDLRDAAYIDLDGAAAAAITANVRLYTRSVAKAVVKVITYNCPPDQDHETALETYLAERAQDAFLWTGFVAAACSGKKTFTEIKKTLHTLPQGLFGLFQRILDDIDVAHRHDVRRVLQWVAFAKRPLYVRELAFLLHLSTTSVQEQVELTCDCISLCESFLRLQPRDTDTMQYLEESNGQQPLMQPVARYGAAMQVALVHDSVRTYLFDPAEHARQGTLSDAQQIGEIHAQLADDCILALSLRCHHRLAAKRLAFPFCKNNTCPVASDWGYHWRNWMWHLKEAGEFASTVVAKLSFFSVRPSAAYVRWLLWTAKRAGPTDMFTLREGMNSLLTARDVGSMPWIRWLTTRWRPHTVKVQAYLNAYLPKAMNFTARRGHTEVLTHLLECGADANHDTIILDVAASGLPEIVRILLEHGADPNARNSTHGQTPLHRAIGSNDEYTMAVLLAHGADINARSNWDHSMIPIDDVKTVYIAGDSVRLFHFPLENPEHDDGYTAFEQAAYLNRSLAGFMLAADDSEPDTLGERWRHVRAAAMQHDLGKARYELAQDPKRRIAAGRRVFGTEEGQSDTDEGQSDTEEGQSDTEEERCDTEERQSGTEERESDPELGESDSEEGESDTDSLEWAVDQMAENEITAQSLEKIYGRRAGRDEQQKRDVKEAAPKK